MFKSKISSTGSIWGEFSSINSSSAPGFIPVPCPSHQQYSITNICKSPNCIEPLCPQCIADHIKLHEQTKKPAKIENIISTRISCIEQLAVMRYEGNKQYEESIQNSSGNITQYVQSQKNKVIIAHKKVQKHIDEFFQDLYSKLDVLSAAFQQQSTRKQNETKLKLAPLLEHLKNINQYKQELESEDYIPALIELLNQPPKKPKMQKIEQIQNFGDIEVNEKYFEELKADLGKFIKANIQGKSNGGNKVGIDRSSYSVSNNMKFSRFERDKERNRSRESIVESGYYGKIGVPENENVESGNRALSRSKSKKKKIFGSQSVVSQISIDSNKQEKYRKYY